MRVTGSPTFTTPPTSREGVGSTSTDLLAQARSTGRPWDNRNFGLPPGHPDINTVRSVLNRMYDRGGPFIQSQLTEFFRQGNEFVVDYNMSSMASFNPSSNRIRLNPAQFNGSAESFAGSQMAIAGGRDTGITVAHELGHWYNFHTARREGDIPDLGTRRHHGYQEGIVEKEVAAEINAYVYRTGGRWPNEQEVRNMTQAVMGAYAPQRVPDDRWSIGGIRLGSDPNAAVNDARIFYSSGSSEAVQRAWERANGGRNGGRNYDAWIEQSIQQLSGHPRPQ